MHSPACTALPDLSRCAEENVQSDDETFMCGGLRIALATLWHMTDPPYPVMTTNGTCER